MPKKFLSLFFHVPCTYLLAHVGAEDYAACAEARRAQAPCKPHPRGSHRQAQGEGVCVRVYSPALLAPGSTAGEWPEASPVVTTTPCGWVVATPWDMAGGPDDATYR
eukprot:1160721-Pelagomonas_calceolata.AAC.3